MAHQGRFRARTAAAVATIVVGGVAAAHSQSLDVDRTLGAEAAAEVESTYGIVEHEKATAWVAAVGQRLVAGLGPQPFEYSFRLVNMSEPNAFAVPAGHVFVAPSLLAVARSEDELAGLLGHEIIHAHERHSVKRLKRGLLPGLLRVPGAIVGSVVDEAAEPPPPTPSRSTSTANSEPTRWPRSRAPTGSWRTRRPPPSSSGGRAADVLSDTRSIRAERSKGVGR